MIGPTCPKCGHVSHPTRAVGVFRHDGPLGYRATRGLSIDHSAPLRFTRAEAEADQCAWQAGRRA